MKSALGQLMPAAKLTSKCQQQQAKQQGFSHDNIVHSMLGLTQVSSTTYRAELDIFASWPKPSRNTLLANHTSSNNKQFPIAIASTTTSNLNK